MGMNEFISRVQVGGDCYRFLAVCFYLPQKEVFAEENLLENLTLSLKKVCPEAAPFSMKMGEALPRYSSEDLSIEYAKLFVGPYELKAPPYGSVYLDRERRVMGDSTMEVIKAYEEQGLSIDNEFREVPDHISVELEFMYYLTCQEVEALKNAERKKALKWIEPQEAFPNSFLRPWVPDFCTRIKEGTDNEFYRALSDCVLTFVDKYHGSRQSVLEALEEGNPDGSN